MRRGNAFGGRVRAAGSFWCASRGFSRALRPISLRLLQTGTNEFRIGVIASRSERNGQLLLPVEFASFSTRTKMRPSEWKLPPLAV
jgi:hypothetical protein